jgi:hypothetical protein
MDSENAENVWESFAEDLFWLQSEIDSSLIKAEGKMKPEGTSEDFRVVSSEDIIDITDMISDYDPLTGTIENFIRFTDSGKDSILSIDNSGSGENFVDIALLEGGAGLNIDIFPENGEEFIII